MRSVGESTCVTGNFHEETQVLKESDVSIKMGIDSSYSAIDAANIVLQKGKLDVLMNTMIYGRNMIINVKKFIE
jgi:magnesium-transporting ATPase (P-type)